MTTVKRLDEITRELTAATSFADILNTRGSYRPSIYYQDERSRTLADEYDHAMEERGDDRRAFRGGDWPEPPAYEGFREYCQKLIGSRDDGKLHGDIYMANRAEHGLHMLTRHVTTTGKVRAGRYTLTVTTPRGTHIGWNVRRNDMDRSWTAETDRRDAHGFGTRRDAIRFLKRLAVVRDAFYVIGYDEKEESRRKLVEKARQALLPLNPSERARVLASVEAESP